ncbi:MAG TPA: geranylgeranyl reductase family protein [Anaerolineales bacterium]
MHEVIVVGAGPAGSVLAYLLARGGLDVLILERANLPRYKSCGGGVTWKAVQNLPFDASPVFEHQATGGVVTYQGRQMLRVEINQAIAWLVMRDKFDHFLAQQAISAGARLKEGTSVVKVEDRGDRVVVSTTHGELQSLLLAGADGVNSRVAHSVGLLAQREADVGLEAELAVSPAELEKQGSYATFDFGAIAGGYGWIFPKRDHLSVGVFKASRGKANGLRRALDRFVASQDVLTKPQILHLQGHQIPLGGRKHALDKGRVLLVGDAANLADPWIGEGISYAIMSAHLAAEQMAKAIENQAFDLSGYTRLINASITPQLRVARLFAKVVFALPQFSSDLLSRSPFLQQLVIDVIQGKRTFREIATASVSGVPRIVTETLLHLKRHPINDQ